MPAPLAPLCPRAGRFSMPFGPRQIADSLSRNTVKEYPL
jgi:hypothetical protein